VVCWTGDFAVKYLVSDGKPRGYLVSSLGFNKRYCQSVHERCQVHIRS